MKEQKEPDEEMETLRDEMLMRNQIQGKRLGKNIRSPSTTYFPPSTKTITKKEKTSLQIENRLRLEGRFERD